MIQKLRKSASESLRTNPNRTWNEGKQLPFMIVIGASAGGPKTIAKLLSCLSSPLSAIISIVQHVDEEFSFGLVNWLDAQTSLKVRLAHEGEQPKIGNVYVAGTNKPADDARHLILTPSQRFAYTSEPLHLPYHPSVDVFFESVAKYWYRKGGAILLTGMGRDGAKGLGLLHDTGWHTIAQDESTSIVYGMPKAAKEIGAASQILAIDEIGPVIIKILQQK